jgi:hypothetical protein
MGKIKLIYYKVIIRLRVFFWRMRVGFENLTGIADKKEKEFFKEIKEL